MSNLLPEKILQKIRVEYRQRLILTGSSLAIGAAVFFLLCLLPSFGVLFISRPATLAQANKAQQSVQDNENLTHTQLLLAQIAPVVTASSSATSAILDALSQKPTGIHVDEIAYTPGAVTTIVIGGMADGRTSTDKYRAALQKDTRFISVKLPVGDLLSTQAARFSVTLSGNF